MKKIFLIFSLVLLIGGSCSKNYLDKKPLDRLTEDDVFNDPKLIDAYVINIYSDLLWMYNDAYMEDGTRGDAYWNAAMSSDISDEGRVAHTWLHPWYRWKQGLMSKTVVAMFDWWGYSTIRKMNVFLDKMKVNTVLTDAEKKGLVARVRFLRAFAYFQMVKRYGGVPLITKAQTLDDPKDELYAKRNKEVEIYDFVNSELDAIVNDLPTGAGNGGHPTKWVALAVKSRSSMYAASIAKNGTVQLDGVVGIPASEAARFWQASYDASKMIIETGPFFLYNKFATEKSKNFRNIFLDENNSEVIFSKQYDGINVGNWWNYLQAPNGYATFGGNTTNVYLEMAEEFENIDGTSGTLDRNLLVSKLWTNEELFGNKDPRYDGSMYRPGSVWRGDTLYMYRKLIKPDGSVITSGSFNGKNAQGLSAPNSSTAFGVFKYLDESLSIPDGQRSNKDWILFRLGEILLNRAEAAFELNKPAEALTDVNRLRVRAGMPQLVSIDMDKIRHERKVELAFEGHRYWDLRRWRTAALAITRNFSGLIISYDFATGKYKIELDLKVDGYTPLFIPAHYYLPIGVNRIVNNSNLVENPGYN